ncbi:MAG: hypothetical protein J2P30_02990 [Actinobacteria bacterium]|nr:hypothetical protein [Actinomycetota bacterium]
MPLRANGGPRRRRQAGYPARYSAPGLFRQGLSLFDAVVSVGHDFGIEVDGFRLPGI